MKLGELCLSCFKGILIFPLELKMHDCICTKCGTRHKVRLYKKGVKIERLNSKASTEEIHENILKNKDFLFEMSERIKRARSEDNVH